MTPEQQYQKVSEAATVLLQTVYNTLDAYRDGLTMLVLMEQLDEQSQILSTALADVNDPEG